MKPLLIAIVSIVLSVAAQFSLKAGMSSAQTQAALAQGLGWSSGVAVLSNRFVLLGFVLYGLGAVIWLAVLARWDVSRAYPLVGLGFVLTAVVGSLAGEQVTPMRLLGVALICAGVVALARS